jgi:hypothetical protein
MQETIAVVQDVLTGNHGRFVVTTSDSVVGSITFSLDEKVWQEASDPEPGEYVVLSDLRRKRAGWRAHSARHVRPDDDVLANSNQQRARSTTQP